ncbi:MAG TPA: outer membrane protein transport protein [Candidatus Nanopelagicales bacterium]|nr:outer membrane protein transport protein [Candidatus Nanopelagicales bacterium]
MITRRPITAAMAALALAFALPLAPRPARASGLDAPIVGPGDAGPTTPSAAAVAWNPAALAFVKQREILLGAGLIIGRVTYQRERRGVYQTPDTFQFKTPLDPANVAPEKTGMADPVAATPIAPTGDAFIAVPVHERLTLGAGVYVPYAAALGFPEDGAQAFQLRQAFIVSSFITASAGVRVTDELAAGLGVSYVSGFAELSKLQDFASLPEFQRAFSNDPINQPNDFGPDAPSEVRELDVLSRPISVKRAFSHGATFNLGLTWMPSDALTVAAAYQHGARMRYRGDVAIDMNDEFFTQDLAAQGLRYKPLVKGDAELSFRLPRRLTLGAGYQISDKLRVDGFVQWVTYSDVDAFVVETRSPDLAQPRLGIGNRVSVRLPRSWNDTVWIEARGQYQMTSFLRGWASAGYQSPASPDSTIDVASPDGHRLIGAAGGELKVSDAVALLGDIRLQGILPRTVTTSDQDLGNGTYGLFIAAFGGHLRILF